MSLDWMPGRNSCRVIGRVEQHMKRDYSKSPGVRHLKLTNVIPTINGREEMVDGLGPDGLWYSISKEEALGGIYLPPQDEIYEQVAPALRAARGKFDRGPDKLSQGTGEDYPIPFIIVPDHRRKSLSNE